MKVTLDIEYNDKYIVVVPHEFLDPNQLRELQDVFKEKKIIVLPSGRIICEEAFGETIPLPDER